MDGIFKDLFEIPEVQGVVLKKLGGGIEYQFFRQQVSFNIKQLNPILDSLGGLREADMVFANLRLYLRRSKGVHLLVIMNTSVPIAMVRLHCDMIIPKLKQTTKKPAKKFWGFLKS
jgi:hypothetical protein